MFGRVTIICLICFFCIPQPIHADILLDGQKKAGNEDKAIIAFFFSKYCKYCDMMEKNVLRDRDIAASLKADVVYLAIDVEKHAELSRKYGVRAYPTTVLIDKSGKKIVQIPGYLEQDDFKKLIAYLKSKHYQRMGLLEYLSGKTYAR